MKNPLIILIIAIFFSCSSSKLVKQYKHPKTNAKMVKLDIEALKKAESKITNEYEITVSTNNLTGTNYYEKIFFETRTSIKISGPVQEGLYFKNVEEPIEGITKYFIFYSNGTVKAEGKIKTKDTITEAGMNVKMDHIKIGRHKYYNKQGAIIKSVDYEKKFKYTIENVITYIETHKFSLPLHKVSITNNNLIIPSQKEGFWTVSTPILIDKDGQRYNRMQINGMTGKLMEKYYVEVYF